MEDAVNNNARFGLDPAMIHAQLNSKPVPSHLLDDDDALIEFLYRESPNCRPFADMYHESREKKAQRDAQRDENTRHNERIARDTHTRMGPLSQETLRKIFPHLNS